MARALSVVDTILAEAGGRTRAERLRDMKAIASVAVNRARQLGVPLEDVISVPSEFNAYGRQMPKGVEEFRSLAEEALSDVLENGPIHNATFYATPKAKANLPKGLAKEDETAGHVYFSDPQNRSIRTAQGFVEPSGETMLASYAPAERVEAAPSAFDGLFGGFSATPQTGFEQRGILSPENASIPSGGLLAAAREGYGSPFGALGDRITSGFGSRTAPRTPFGIGSSNHRGIDMSLQPGETGYPVEAVNGGRVTYAGPSRSYGNLVEIEHPDGMKSRYGHLASIGPMAIGDEIARGTPVGLVGNTGRSQGPHLHFETIDAEGRQVDPRSVIDFNAASRVPTPIERPQEWQDATPMAIERRDLPAIRDGLLANDMRHNPASSVSDRMVDMAKPAEGLQGLRDSMWGEQPIGRATPTQMADMQQEANRSRQALDARMSGSLQLTEAQTRDALRRREASMGLLTASQPQQSLLASAEANQTQATPSVFTGLSSYPSNVAATERLTGLTPTMTQTTATGPLQKGLLDLTAPVGLTEYTGVVGENPAQIRAGLYGMQPTPVQSVDMGLLNQPALTATLEGPATAQAIRTPQRSTSYMGGGLLSPAEDDMVRSKNIAIASMAENKSRKLKDALGGISGAIAGGILAGPIGALAGTWLGNNLQNGPRGYGQNYFPARPKGGVRGEGRSWNDRDSWNGSMRDTYNSSKQVRDAVDKGQSGLW